MTLSIDDELQRILSEPVPSVIDRERNALQRLLDECLGKVVLFGAGGLGRQALACLRSIGIHALAVSDNNHKLWGTQLDGVEVVAPDVAAKRFGADALFIVTIWNPFHWYSETRDQLEALGCARITPPSPLYWRFADTFLPFYAQAAPHTMQQQAAAILDAARIWTDDRSRQEYLQQISWRLAGSWAFKRPLDETSYFLNDVFDLIDDEVFIDCGAFDGDTLREYLSRRQNAFKHFVAIEPDQVTFRRLKAYVDGLADGLRQKISTLNCAVGSQRETIGFHDTGGVGSKASDDGTSPILSLPISEVAASWMPITYIKMDIEGAEHDALVGARPVIERDQPLLAVCVYHTPVDLWRIPLLMKRMVPEHRMYLRCYEGDGWQTVAYAVPPSRVLQGRAQ